jgi:hypothetical protein
MSHIYIKGFLFGSTTSFVSSLYYATKGEFNESFNILYVGSFLSLTWPISVPYLIAGSIGMSKKQR